jgi:hypothetical protein
LDNDPPPSVRINNVRLREGQTGFQEMIFTITLTAASGREVQVDYATANGTARASGDYTAIRRSTLTFNPSETTKTITVRIRGDSAKESNETFFVDLLSVVNAVLANRRGTGTILNDD